MGCGSNAKKLTLFLESFSRFSWINTSSFSRYHYDFSSDIDDDCFIIFNNFTGKKIHGALHIAILEVELLHLFLMQGNSEFFKLISLLSSKICFGILLSIANWVSISFSKRSPLDTQIILVLYCYVWKVVLLLKDNRKINMKLSHSLCEYYLLIQKELQYICVLMKL